MRPPLVEHCLYPGGRVDLRARVHRCGRGRTRGHQRTQSRSGSAWGCLDVPLAQRGQHLHAFPIASQDWSQFSSRPRTDVANARAE
eukprot:933538-Prorocentrum_lima.AAC.1